MPTPTYDLIQEQVLSSTAASVTFSSIPGTYKDLVIEILNNGSAGTNSALQYNGDSGTNYSSTQLYGNGSTAASTRQTNVTGAWCGVVDNVGVVTIQIMSYANTNVQKTAVARGGAAGGTYLDAVVSLWRSTAAITSVTVFAQSSFNWAANSRFRLWGISA